MSKKLKKSSKMSPLAEYVERNLHSPSYAGESDASKSPPSSPRSVSSYSFITNEAPVMVTNATIIEEQLASLTRAIEGLTKHVQEQDAQIARLINKVDNVDASHIMGKQVEAHDEVEAPTKQHYIEKDKYANELQISSDGLIPMDQLKEFIEGTIRSNIEGSSKSSLTYSKPYTPRIDTLKMLMGYQPMDYINSKKWVEGPPIQELRGTKEKQEVKKWGKPFSKVPSKESIIVNVAPFKLKNTAKDNVAPRNNVSYKRPQRKLTLKEMQVREYPFLDFDVPGIFDDLLEANLINLPEMKRPEEAERKNDPKYCKYHRLVGHVIQDCFVFKDKVMQLAHQGKISLEEDSTATNAITIKSGHVDGNKDSCNTMHGDYITSNKDTLFEKEESSDADDCMSIITFTDEDLLLGSKPHNHPLFVVGYYYIEDAKKGNEVLPPKEPKSCNNQNTRKNDSSTLEVELSKGITVPLTQINMKQPSKAPLKGFVPSTQEKEEGYETLTIDEKGYDPKEKLSLGKLHPKATGKKLHGLNATQIMLKEKGHAI
ncbi:UNVERIFIED_CONTAM: hypothetical protein Scaly_1618800 [Sesamum calycinum]|uniref:Retrotransposon gag protein n=1 Tax=Sesamum calycinum TaxID=2727403 RepID=A0AAW2PCL0_9LAMI